MDAVTWKFLAGVAGSFLFLVWVLARARDSWWFYVVVCPLYLGAVFASGLVFMRDVFDLMRMCAIGIFVIGPIFLSAEALLAWKRYRKISFACFAAIGIVLAAGIDAFFIEPHWLAIDRWTIESPKISDPVQIAILADIQTDNVEDYERRVIASVMKEQPDLILLAGDYVQALEEEPYRKQISALNRVFRECNLRAPLGAYAVAGNTDWNWQMIFEGLPVKTFDETWAVDTGNIRITGLHPVESFNQDVRIGGTPYFHIVLGHSPNFALGRVDADLIVAGHTHGGQVQIPIFGPPITFTAVPRKWAAGGVNRVDDDTWIAIPRGIGMERIHAPRLRFLCRPQVIIVELVPVRRAQK